MRIVAKLVAAAKVEHVAIKVIVGVNPAPAIAATNLLKQLTSRAVLKRKPFVAKLSQQPEVAVRTHRAVKRNVQRENAVVLLAEPALPLTSSVTL